MEVLSDRFDQLLELLDGADSVVVVGHENADGDAVGSVAALRRHLEMGDKQVTALLTAPLSPRYDFMEFGKNYEVYETAKHEALIRKADVFIMCDLSSLSRLGVLEDALEGSAAQTVCFDHHPCAQGGPAKINILDSAATATGCLVYDYIKHVDGVIDREIAESVFVSLCTDTGWFRYSNTTNDVMKLVADLTEHELDLPLMYRSIYQSNSSGMVRLMGHIARTMNEECDGTLVWAHVRRDFIEALGVERYDADPILDLLRSGETSRVVALFTELEDGRTSVSLRSRGGLDMNVVAREFGGGGHLHAAGTTLAAETSDEDRRRMVAMLRKLLLNN
jgi:phosphoesterase RecJ-like protein